MNALPSNTDAPVFLDRLRGWFARRDPDEGALPGQPHRRGLAISMCVLISVVLWFTLSLRQSYTDVIEMPTQVVNLDDDLALSQPLPPTVQAQVRGEGIDLFRLRLNPPVVRVDAAQDEVSLDDMVFDLPEGVVSESVSPRTFSLRKEPRVSRTVPVELRVDFKTGEAAELLYPPALDPDSVVVSGARSIIENLAAWPTERRTFVVKDRGRPGGRDSLVVQVPLADTLAGLGVNRSHLTTTATVVAEDFTEAELLLRVDVTGVPSNQRVVSLDPSTVTVRFRVPVSQFDEAMKRRDFLAIVSYDEIRADTSGRVTPQMDYPPDLLIRQVRIEPLSVRYYERLVQQ